MPPRISWSNLLPGLLALGAVVLVAIGVIVFAGVGRIRGETMRLYVVTNQARGVMRGSEVWLEGQQVGVVDKIEFGAPGTDTAGGGRVVITMSVKKEDAEQIRRDSPTQVRAGANVIGPMVVYLSAGTPAGAAAREGDTLRARAQLDAELASVKLNTAMDQLAPLTADARTVMAHVRDPNGGGTVAAALAERGGGEMARLRAQVGRLRARLFSGGGGGGGAKNPTDVMLHARSALARVDSIRALLKSPPPHTSLGRFRRDSSLNEAVVSLRDELAQLRVRLDETDGTLGRFSGDSAITRAVADAQREMALLSDDLRRRPFRYIVF